MKAVRLHKFHTQPVIDDVPEPTISGPLDVIVKIGGAGVCRTDLHIIEGQWDAAMGTPLPYILGHENAGWVHEIGSGVTNVQPGDTVILHPLVTDGVCHACRAGDDMHCEHNAFPGLSRDGGMAEYLLTSERACIKLNPETQPKDVAALADAGITAYHAVRKAIPLLYPGTSAVVIGAGGLGHIGVQCLEALTSTATVPLCATTLTLPCRTLSSVPSYTFTVVEPRAPSTIAALVPPGRPVGYGARPPGRRVDTGPCPTLR